MDFILEILKPWLWSIVVFLAFLLIRYFYKTVLLKLLHRFNSHTSFEYGEDILTAFEKPIHLFLLILGIYSALNVSPLSSVAQHSVADRILRSFLILCFFWGFYNLSDTTHGLAVKIMHQAGIKLDEALSNIASTVFRIIISILAFVMIAKEWNYDISAFIASLGIGSLAVAFAAKDALANVFGSLIIIIDKPFQVGDWISANGVEGTVEKITFRSTCLRTFPQELVYIPNSLLSNTPITNFTKREKRRLDFSLGVTYNTTRNQMSILVKRIHQYLENSPDVFDDGITVSFSDFGASSLDIRIICYTKITAYISYMELRQQINLDLMQILEEENASCAFPSTSVYFETPLTQKNVNTNIITTNTDHS